MDPDIIDSKIMDIFRCPFCYKYLTAPIGQCTQGHCFCPDCFKKIYRCNVCQAEKSTIRCRTMERLRLIVCVFECKYKHQGCDFKGEDEIDVYVHEIMCEVPDEQRSKKFKKDPE